MASFIHDKRGSIAVLTGIMLPVLVGFMALGAETGLWFVSERKVSQAADVAAYSSASAYLKGLKGKADLKLNAQNVVANAGWPSATVSVETLTPEELGADEIQVTVRRSIPRYLTRILTDEPMVVAAVSRVRLQPGGPVCILGLDPSANGAITAWGSAKLDLAGCSLHANSSSATAVAYGGSSSIKALCASTVGKTHPFDDGDLDCGSPSWGRPAIADPFANKANPVASAVSPYGPCETRTTTGGLTYLTPGVCTNSVKPSGTLHLLPGIYEFRAGLEIKGTVKPLSKTEVAKLNLVSPMDGTTLVFTHSSKLGFTGQGTLSFDPPLTGPAAGIAIWGRGTDVLDKMTGGNTIETQGLVYLPNSDLVWRGGSSADSAKCLRMVAATVDFSGNSELILRCNAGNAYLDLVDLKAVQKIGIVQ